MVHCAAKWTDHINKMSCHEGCAQRSMKHYVWNCLCKRVRSHRADMEPQTWNPPNWPKRNIVRAATVGGTLAHCAAYLLKEKGRTEPPEFELLRRKYSWASASYSWHQPAPVYSAFYSSQVDKLSNSFVRGYSRNVRLCVGWQENKKPTIRWD